MSKTLIRVGLSFVAAALCGLTAGCGDTSPRSAQSVAPAVAEHSPPQAPPAVAVDRLAVAAPRIATAAATADPGPTSPPAVASAAADVGGPQVAEDAAAVGMTTREGAQEGAEPKSEL